MLPGSERDVQIVDDTTTRLDWDLAAFQSAPVQMPAGRAEAEVTVVLPDPPK